MLDLSRDKKKKDQMFFERNIFRWIFKAGVQILSAKLSSKYISMESFVSYMSQIRGNLAFVLLKALFHCVASSNGSQFPLKHFPDLAVSPVVVHRWVNFS